MGQFREANITELRVFDNPADPENSSYRVALPITVMDAVIDAETGKSLKEAIGADLQQSLGEIKSGIDGLKTGCENLNGSIGAASDAANENGGTIWAILKWLKNKFVGIWTDARAAKLDNLDARVSSRAPSDTALSSATWTDGLAASLGGISGQLGGIVAALNAGIPACAVKSVQRGFASFSYAMVGIQRIAINEVNTYKSTIKIEMYNNATTIRAVYFENSTTIAIDKNNETINVNWEVVEFY